MKMEDSTSYVLRGRRRGDSDSGEKEKKYRGV